MMKYCPYCGAELLNAEDEWCSACGQKQTGLPEDPAEKRKAKKKTLKKRKDKKTNKKSRNKKEKQVPIPEVLGEPVDVNVNEKVSQAFMKF